MTEADYILVSTLIRVRAARSALGEIIPTNDATEKAIPHDELRKVHRLVYGWTQRLEKLAENRRDESGDDEI